MPKLSAITLTAISDAFSDFLAESIRRVDSPQVDSIGNFDNLLSNESGTISNHSQANKSRRNPMVCDLVGLNTKPIAHEHFQYQPKSPSSNDTQRTDRLKVAEQHELVEYGIAVHLFL